MDPEASDPPGSYEGMAARSRTRNERRERRPDAETDLKLKRGQALFTFDLGLEEGRDLPPLGFRQARP